MGKAGGGRASMGSNKLPYLAQCFDIVPFSMPGDGSGIPV